jgi:hypothetical protein
MMDADMRSRPGWVLSALLAVVAGLIPALAAFDIGPLHAADINGPPWLGLAAGSVFIAGGLAMLAGAAIPALQAILGVLALAGMATIVNWIAFGAGERACSGAVGFLWLAADSAYAGLACRIPFGLGAAIIDAVLILGVVALLQQALGGAPQLARTIRAAQGLLLLALAPLLLLALVVAVLPVALGVVWHRLRSGHWPRNAAFIRRRP